jgi:hypothetical protein
MVLLALVLYVADAHVYLSPPAGGAGLISLMLGHEW